MIDSQEIVDIFTLLNENKLDYILLRNINKELPNGLGVGKDIDILIRWEDRKKFYSFFELYSFQKIPHPHQNDIFLYGVNKFEFLKNKANVLFDLNFQLAVRSLDAGQWIPLDQNIQESAWKNKRHKQQSDNFGYWTLSYEDEFIALVVRSIFDKKEFQSGYIKRINELYSLINKNNVIEKFNMVFFKYTPYLMKSLEQNDYENIIKNYLEFKEY